MTALPITPPSAARVDAARKGAAPPSGSPGDFAALLSQTSARTAPAEGPKTRPAQPEPRRRDDAAPQDDGQEAAVVADGQAAPAPAPQPVATGDGQDTPQGEGQAAAGETPAPPAAPAPAPAADPAAAAAAAAAVLTSAATPAVPVAPVPASTAPATAQAAVLTAAPVAADGAPPADPKAAAADGAPGGKLQIPAELLAAKGDGKAGQGKDHQHGEAPKRDLPPAPTLPPAAPAATTAAAAPATAAASTTTPAAAAAPAADQAAASAPTISTQAQPAATPQTAVPVASGGVGGTALTRASVLQTAERVQELVRIATTRAGNARATLQLRPAELGQVDVHLRTTREGLVATISAHDQVGHDALQQAGNELRRTLEDKGVQLHSLDLQLGAGQHGFANQGDAREASSGRRGAAASHQLGTDDVAPEDDLTLTTAPSTPAGALVDVRA